MMFHTTDRTDAKMIYYCFMTSCPLRPLREVICCAWMRLIGLRSETS